MSAPRALPDPVLDALWKKVVDDWKSDGAHGAFIDHCHRTRQLLEAAVRYRGMSGDHVRGPSAGKRLEAIALLAVTELETQRTPERRGMQVATQIALILLFVGATLALLVQLYR
jgi:hypothetical protein